MGEEPPTAQGVSLSGMGPGLAHRLLSELSRTCQGCHAIKLFARDCRRIIIVISPYG